MGKSITMCGVEECDRKSVSKGYCDKHYRRLRKYGDPRMLTRGGEYSGPEVPVERQCAVDLCRKPKERRDWCRRHHRLWQLNGDPLVDSSRDDEKLCGVDGCADTVRVSGYCYAHYARLRRHGDPLAGGAVKNVAIDHDDGDRTCATCQLKQPITAFHAAIYGRRKRRLDCAKCTAEDRSRRYLENREQYAASDLARAHERRARINGGAADKGITRSRLREIHGDECVYCGVEMMFNPPSRKQPPTLATIEHLIPLSRGGSHTWENIALACRSCNYSKSSKTPEEFTAHLDALMRAGSMAV